MATAVRSPRVLDPSERAAEVLFGLIMVLTFTGTLSVAEAGRTDIRAMLAGALGCNLAWGVIDAVLYLMGSLASKSRPRTLTATDSQGALAVFLLVFLSTFPVALPFLLVREPSTAMRISNAIAVAMLFVVGREYGRAIDLSPWAVGVCMVLLGAALVALTIALGG
jgi:VIT1/CCC1 family predicted Fe2+/Mn2+ transporter